MGLHTDIQWCDSSLNLEMGCDGCELWNPKAGVRRCYAGIMTEKWAGTRGWPKAFDRPKLFVERLPEALRWRDLRGVPRPKKPWIPTPLPRLIFVNDMGDSFSESLPLDWLAPHLEALAASRHIYILLTKRPRRMADFFSRHRVPTNVWLCTSITNNASLKRVEPLLDIDAPVRGLSVEPLWEELHLDEVKGLERLHWVKIGGESGADAKPCELAWIRRVAHDCASAGLAVFVKQLGANAVNNGVPLGLKHGHGADWTEWPEDLRVRQMPLP
jgi:protein gp37